MNDIAEVTFKLAQPLFVDPYADNRATGAYIVIDESNNTVGAGTILQARSRRSTHDNDGRLVSYDPTCYQF